jgi:hypothetical protein
MSDEPQPAERGFPLYGAGLSDKYQRVTDATSIYSRHNLTSVDPGGEHVGVAQFAQAEDLSWQCIWAGEMTPLQFEDWLSEQMILGQIDTLVIEEWVLFPDKAMQQVGSDMPTSQLIGVIRYIHRMTHSIAARWPDLEPVQLVFQPPTIKIPTRSLLRTRGLTSMAKYLKIPKDHAADAELHGYYRILKTLGDTVDQSLIRRLKGTK